MLMINMILFQKLLMLLLKGKLTIQCDEMWVGILYIGSRDTKGAQRLWNSLPPVYRQCAVSFTDFWKAYDTIFPKS